MKTTIGSKLVKNLNDREVAALSSLTLRGQGLMRYRLGFERNKAQSQTAKAYYVKEALTKKVLGWALVFESSPYNGLKRDHIYFYVRHSARRCGIAERLFTQAAKDWDELWFSPSDAAGWALYDKLRSKSDQITTYYARPQYA